MLLIPLRSEPNASDRPSGAQAGLIFFPLVHVPEDIDRAVVEMEEGDAQVAELQRREIGGGAANR